MSSFELNKIFAAVLVAGIVAMLGGFIAKQMVHPHALEKDAVFIEGVTEDAGGGGAVAALPQPILNLIATADVAQGEKLSKACAACHAFDKGGANKVGPGLWGIVGNRVATHAGFAYSEPMAAHGGSWDYLSLNKFLWNPKKHVPGTKMTYAGLKKPEDRAALIAWLRTMADGPTPLPSAAQIEAEAKELAPPPVPEAAAAAAPATEAAATPAAAPAAPAH